MSIQISNNKLRIDGDSKFVLRDGTQQPGRILVSDSEGNASWKSGRSLVGNDRYIGEIYGGGVVVGIWRDSNEEKILIVYPRNVSGYLYNSSNGYGISAPSIPWAQRPFVNITQMTQELAEDTYQIGAWSSSDGAYNNMMVYKYIAQTNGRKFSGISQFYNFPTLLHLAIPSLHSNKLNGYSDWYVPSLQEMKMITDNAIVIERSYGEKYRFLGPKDEAFGEDRQFIWTSTEKLDYNAYDEHFSERAWAYDKRSNKMVARTKTLNAEVILVRTETTNWIQSPQKETLTPVGNSIILGTNLSTQINKTPFTAMVTMCLDATDKLSYNDSRMPNRWTDTVTYGLTSSRSFYVNPGIYNSAFGGYFSFTALGNNSGNTVEGSILNPSSMRDNNASLAAVVNPVYPNLHDRIPEHITMEFWTRPRKPSYIGNYTMYNLTLVSFPVWNAPNTNPNIAFRFDETEMEVNITIINNTAGAKSYILPIAQVLNKWIHLVVSACHNDDTTAQEDNVVVWVNGQRLTANSNLNGWQGDSSPFDLGFRTATVGSFADLPDHVGTLVGKFTLGANQNSENPYNWTGFDQPSPEILEGSYYNGDIALFRTFDRLLTNSETNDLYNSRKDLYNDTNAGTTHAIDQGPGPGTFSVVQKMQLVLPGRKNMKVLRSTANGTASWVEKNYLFYRPDNKREIGEYYGGGIIVAVNNYPANVYNYTIMSLDDVAGPYLGTFSFGKPTPTTQTKNNFIIDGWDLADELTYFQTGGGTVPNAPNSAYPLFDLYRQSWVYDPNNDSYFGLGLYPWEKENYNDIPFGSWNYGIRAIRYQNGVTTISGMQEDQNLATPGDLNSTFRRQVRSTWMHRNIGYRWRGYDTTSISGAMSMYDGVANTNAIFALGGPTWSAAAACRLFSVDGFAGSQGFNDWYLPAIYELELAFKNILAISSKSPRTAGVVEFTDSVPQSYTHGRPLGLGGTYWSSTDYNTSAWAYTFGNNIGYQATNVGTPPVGNSTGGWPEMTGAIKASKDKRFFVRAFRKVSILANYKTWGEPSPNDEPVADWYVDPFDEKNWTPYTGLKKGAIFNIDTDRPPSYDGRFNGWSSVIYNRQNGVLGTPSTGTVLQGVTWSSTEVALYFNGTWSSPGTLFKRNSYIEFNGPLFTNIPSTTVIEAWVKPTHEVSSITSTRGIVCTHGFSVDDTDPIYASRVYAGYAVSLSANDGSDTYAVVFEYGNGAGGGSEHRKSYLSASRPVIKDKWNHIVVRYTHNTLDKVSAVYLWVNGKRVGYHIISLGTPGVYYTSGLWSTGSAEMVAPLNIGVQVPNTKMLIGCHWVGAKYVFEGWIGKVRVYAAGNSVITDEEVSNNYEKDRVRYDAAKPVTYPVAVTVSYTGADLVLHLDSSSYLGLGIWGDLSGNFNESALSQTRVNSNSTPTFTSVANRAGFLTMTSNWFNVPINSVLSNFNAGITIIVIADFGNADAAERLIDFGNGQGANNILFGRIGTGNNLMYQIYNGSTLTLSAPFANGVIPNRWGFYGVRNSSTSTKVFNQFSSITYNTTDLPTNVARGSNFIGKSNWVGDATFSGKLAVVAVWKRALTDREIDDFYNFYKSRYDFSYTTI